MNAGRKSRFPTTPVVSLAAAILFLATAGHVLALHFVDPNSPHPGAPFISWDTAAHTIQVAIDAAGAGETIVVTNGTYATGGRAVFGTLTNRVAVDKPLRLLSANGPQFTVIQGYQLPGATNGDGAIRCVYLTNGASLSGFTLMGGATRSAGDLICEQGGGGILCESSAAIVSNCVVTGNAAGYGGGACDGTLRNCTLAGNHAGWGGGAARGTLINCLLTGNSATRDGGGADVAALINCTLAGNHAGWGGGAADCRATNCIMHSNTAAFGDNFYYNSGSFGEALMAYCYAGDPLFVNPAGGDFRLQSSSPCINIGNNALAPTGTDLDGNPRIYASVLDLGAYERQVPGSPITPYILLQPTDQMARAGANATFTFTGGGSAPLSYQWNFGGLPLVGATNASLTLTNVFLSQAGIYALIITNLAGAVTASNALLTVALTRYVDAHSTTPTPPFTNWATAAATIQEAVDVSGPGDDIVVTNGTYATGGPAVPHLINRVNVDKPLTVRSVNGPQFTVIEGYQLSGATNGDGGIRCVSLMSGAGLIGFTLTNGATEIGGAGGIECAAATAMVSNCVVAGNAGWGVVGGTLNNCIVTGNAGGGVCHATLNNCMVLNNAGDGADVSTLNGCTVAGNTGVGAYGWYWGKSGAGCTLNNCILYYNRGGNYNTAFGLYTMNNCCTIPASSWGSGNLTNEPLFVNLAGGDYHLQAVSPCINAGTNFYASAGTDLDGQPRIVGGTVDLGAYEFQGSVPPPFPTWLPQFGLPADGSADDLDSDGDGLNNRQEWRCGTNPTNAISALRLLSATRAGTDVTVTWQSVAGMYYFLEGSTNLAAVPPFLLLVENLPGHSSTTSYTDTNSASAPRLFYRVGVP